MKQVAAASIVFVLAMMYVISGFAPQIDAGQNGNTSGQEGEQTLRDGQSSSRFDTFGDEQLWTDVLRMHEAIATSTRRRHWRWVSRWMWRPCRRRSSRRFGPERSISQILP